jgi:hypothetical protein
MNSAIRPFQHIRYEYEQRHIYYLPSKIMAQIESPKPAYLLGTRGTGKTTLLKALEWEERLNNRSLRRQLGSDPFQNRFVGCYLKLPLYMLVKLEERLPNLYPTASDVLLGLYLDLIVLQPICTALAGLAAEGVLDFSPEAEAACCEQLVLRFRFLNHSKVAENPSLKALIQSLHSAQRELEGAVLYDREVGTTVLDAVSNVGELGRELGQELGELCNGDKSAEPWYFKACLDEAESLGPLGRKVLNTIVRMSKAPLFHVAAFVGPPDALVETLNQSLTLAEDDRSLVHLDQQTNQDFKLLAEGVATARIQESVGSSDYVVKLDAILGKLDLNGLAISILKESVDPEGRALLKDLKTAGETDVLTKFLESAMQKDAPPESEDKWERRRRDSTFRRKAMVAAYLALCRKIDAVPRYASGDMLIEMSDHCIRDFLRFLNDIYIEADVTPENFCSSVISPKVQDAAIKRSSRTKVDCLAESGVHEPLPTRRIIDGLAQITSTLQCSGRDNSNFKSPERGIFKLNVAGLSEIDRSWLGSLLSEAIEAGFLILKNRTPESWSFRVHKSLAAFYRFSYRGAYYDVSLAGDDLLKLARADDSAHLAREIKMLTVKLLGGDADSTPLFDFEYAD